MKPHSDVTLWLRHLAEVVVLESNVCTSVIAKSLDAGGMQDATAASLREQLAAVALLLHRQHEDLVERIKEQFGAQKAPDHLAPLRREFESAARRFRAEAIAAVRRSIDVRMRLSTEEAHRFDAHTRLMFRVHRSIAEGVIQPACDAALALCPAPRSTPAADAIDFESFHRAVLPAPRAHPDDFLGFRGAVPEAPMTK